MKRAWLIAATALIFVGCITAVCALAMQDWDFSRLSTVNYETNTHPVTEDFHNISINTDTAHVTFLPADGTEAYVICREQENLRHTVTVADGTLTVALRDDRKWYDYIGVSFGSTSITLYLPEEEYGALLVHADTSDVDIPGNFRFESVDVHVSTGDVRCLASADGDISLRASTGDIRADSIAAKNISFTVSTGRIHLSSVACAGNLTVTVTTGKAELSDIPHCGWFRVAFNEESDALDALAAYLEPRYGQYFAFCKAEAEIYEFQSIRSTKGLGLDRLRAQLIAEGRADDSLVSYAAGDYGNDLELLRHADVPCCPANAIDSIKAIARVHLCHCDDGCIGDLIERIERGEA